MLGKKKTDELKSCEVIYYKVVSLRGEGSVNRLMCRDDFMNLVEELQPYIKPDLALPNWTALSSCNFISPNFFLFINKN